MWTRALDRMPKLSHTEWQALDPIAKWLIACRASVLFMTFTAAALGGLMAWRAGVFEWNLWLATVLGLSLTGKALRDLAGETLESRIVERALAQLPDRGRELAMTSERGHTALALTRDPLPAQTQERLRVALSEVLPDARLDFRTDPARPLGLGLQLGGVQVDWTIESYLDDLAGRLDELAAATAKMGVSDAA